MKTQSFLASFLCLTAFVLSAHAETEVWQPLPASAVSLGGEMGRRITATCTNNLLKLDVENVFLKPFREKKGGEGMFIGTGALLESAARFAAYTRDPALLAFRKELFAKFLATQQADGYIGLMKPENRMWKYWDMHEMSFILHGLVVNYQLFSEKASLDAARRTADYILAHWNPKPEGWEEGSIGGEEGTLEMTVGMILLSQCTGDSRYRDFAIRERHLGRWNLPIVLGRNCGLKGQVYVYLYQCVAQMTLYLNDPNPAPLRSARRAADFLLNHDGITVSGESGVNECWTDDQSGCMFLGETCATAYELRLFDRLLRLSPEVRYGDTIERIVYNALFAAQEPCGRHLRYFTPMDCKRAYFGMDSYCCPGNFRRIMSELPEYVYYTSPGGVLVNLYTPSRAKIALADKTPLEIEQKTDYPTGETVTLAVNPSKPAAFALSLRIPGWCKAPKLSVNGQTSEAKPGTFASIRRTWKTSDTVKLELPMDVRAIAGRKCESGRIALLRGPLVYGLNPEKAATNPDDSKYFKPHPSEYTAAMMIDPTSAKVVSDNSARQDGTAILLHACLNNFDLGVTESSPLIKLTEFADPDVEATYFRVPDWNVAKPDDLFHGEKTAVSPFTVEKPVIMAHRGGSVEYADNAISGFERCYAAGIRAFETDIRMTSDGGLALMHDDTVDHTTLGKGIFESMTLAQMTNLTLRATKEKVPAYQQFLDVFAGKPADYFIELEIKTGDGQATFNNYKGHPEKIDELCEKTYALTTRALPKGTYVYMSFDKRVLKAMKRLHPDAPTGYNLGGPFSQKNIDEMLTLGCSLIATEVRYSSKETISAAHEAGLLVSGWFGHDWETYRKARDLGFDYVVCGAPRKVFAVRAKSGE